MTFWNWRRGTGGSAVSGTAAVALAPELAPIELYTAQTRIVGWIEANGLRVTDLLNASPELRLWRPSPAPLDGTLTDPALPSKQPMPADGAGEWQTITTERIIVAMPPEWRASRQLRLHKRLRRVAISAGPFNVTGNIHLAPGVEVGPHLLARGPRWMPLTEVYLLHTGDPPFEHVVSVVVVNTAYVTQLLPLMTLA